MSTALATNEQTRKIQDFLSSAIGELSRACPGHLSAEKMVQVASLLVYRTPKLQECDKESILSSVIQASSLGLDLSPSMGEAWLIPRWNKNTRSNECQFQPGYQGLVKLARQSNAIDYIQARLVYSKDKFSVRYDPELSLSHEPFFGHGRGDITHVYAVVKLLTGARLIEVMSWEEIESVRARSTSKDFGPWVTDWPEMAKKTVLKRLAKSLPRSTELATAIELDNREYSDDLQLEKPKNNSGHGTGMYASEEYTAAYLKAMTGYLESRTDKWLDRWTRDDGIAVKGLKNDLVTKWQADNHLVKWAIETGRLDKSSATEDGIKARQIGRFTAIIYHKSEADRKALARELDRYCDEQEERQAHAIIAANPDLFPEDTTDAEFEDDAAFEERLAREQAATA